MKACNRCKVEKPFTDFFKDIRHSSGHYSICKICKEQSTKEWRIKNREKYNAKMRDYYKNNRDAVVSSKLVKKYGITLKQKHEMLAAQDNKCWICRKINTSTKRPFAVDHHHSDLKVRGILCYGCNRTLHAFEDKGLFDQALVYLDHFK